jgi:hypothetical protein
MLVKAIKKVCMYYGAFSLTCKLLDRIYPEGAASLQKFVAEKRAQVVELPDEEKDPMAGYVKGDRVHFRIDELLLSSSGVLVDMDIESGHFKVNSSRGAYWITPEQIVRKLS